MWICFISDSISALPSAAHAADVFAARFFAFLCGHGVMHPDGHPFHCRNWIRFPSACTLCNICVQNLPYHPGADRFMRCYVYRRGYSALQQSLPENRAPYPAYHLRRLSFHLSSSDFHILWSCYTHRIHLWFFCTHDVSWCGRTNPAEFFPHPEISQTDPCAQTHRNVTLDARMDTLSYHPVFKSWNPDCGIWQLSWCCHHLPAIWKSWNQSRPCKRYV